MKIDMNDPYTRKVFDFLKRAQFGKKYHVPDLVRKDNEERFMQLVLWYLDYCRIYWSLGWSWVDEHTLYRDNFVPWVLDRHPEWKPFLKEYVPLDFQF